MSGKIIVHASKVDMPISNTHPKCLVESKSV